MPARISSSPLTSSLGKERGMARVPYVDPERATDERVGQLYREIAQLRGSVLNLYRALANQPEALRSFMVMSRHVRDESSLPGDLRELGILAVAHTLDVPYERMHHEPAARRAGVSEEQIAALPRWRESGAFDPAQRAVLAYAESVARHHAVDAATFDALREHLSREQLVDLAVTIAWYHFCAALIGPLEIDLER
ncbi:carboxymuconolactone decarboxylase family protein [bacterium]|nr:MAG: carboxymuconolactone decarboxylase family protein [bacterium]